MAVKFLLSFGEGKSIAQAVDSASGERFMASGLSPNEAIAGLLRQAAFQAWLGRMGLRAPLRSEFAWEPDRPGRSLGHRHATRPALRLVAVNGRLL